MEKMMNKITKEELKSLEWLIAIDVSKMSIMEIAKRMEFHDLKKIEAFLEYHKISYKKSED